MSQESLINYLHATGRSLKEITNVAPHFEQVPLDELEKLMENLIEEGEDKAVGILLNIIAYLRIQFPPKILCKSLKVVLNIDDFTYPFREQDDKAITFLLELAQASDVSVERNILAVFLAAQLSCKFKAEKQKVKKVLTQMLNSCHMSEDVLFLQTIIAFMDEMGPDDVIPLLVDRDIYHELDKSRNINSMAHPFTVRRPVPKISRNAPCHCGSGKKYKKCCIDKDQELLQDASPYAGLTMSQVMSSPELVEDTQVINNMQAYQIKKLNPEKLNNDQLLAAYRKADSFKLHEIAYKMLSELKRRPDQEDFAVSHMHDLLHSALEDGNLELSKILESQIPEDDFEEEATMKFHMFLLENIDHFMVMEKHCRKCLTQKEEGWKDNIVDMAYCFEKHFPALNIVFCRTAIMEENSGFLDYSFLLEMIRHARTELDLDPMDDPIEDFLEWSAEIFDQDSEIQAKDREIQQLKEKISETRHTALKQDRELKEKESELQALSRKLETEARLRQADSMEKPKSHSQTADQADVLHLKRRIERMKMEIREQQSERRRLRQHLKNKEAEKNAIEDRTEHVQENAAKPEPGGLTQDSDFTPKKVTIPYYSDQFRRSCEQFSAGIVAKALRAVAGFASHDQDILRISKRLERISSIYRIKISLNHRLMIRHEKDYLEVLDLINRQDLNKWIKQHSGQG